MHIVVKKSDILLACTTLLGLTEKKTTMPVLVNTLFAFEGDKITLTASNLETSARIEVSCLSKPGTTTTAQILLNTRLFTDIVRESAADELTMTLGDRNRVKITSAGATSTITGLNAAEYPPLSGFEHETKISLPTADFIDGINKTIYATVEDESRFNLFAVNLTFEESSLLFVTTDARRVASARKPAATKSLAGTTALVPRRPLAEARRILERHGEVSIGVASKFFILASKGLKIVCRLVDGEFPETTRSLKIRGSKKIVVDRQLLIAAIRRVALMAVDMERKMRIELESEKMTLSTASANIGEAHEIIGVPYTGEPMRLGINSKFLIDACSSFADAENIVIELEKDNLPARVYAENDDSCFAVIMPMRF